MIIVDGSRGEGGGQILRTALGLSLVTGRPFRIEKIRAGRARPGLLRQHLTSLRAAIAVSDADVEGAELGSRAVTFTPRTLRGGAHHFEVGSAGGASLVFQTILPALLRAPEPSEVVIEGGTHNSAAPPFPFLASAFLPALARMGIALAIELEAHGFYPAGGGRLRAKVSPCPSIGRLELLARGAITARSVQALVSRVSTSVGRREVDAVRQRLAWTDDDASSEVVEVRSSGPGNVLVVTVRSENVTEVFTGFGERGMRAEDVARSVADEARAYLDAGVPVGEHLADQLVLPMAMGEGGRFRTVRPSGHLVTQIETVRVFTERETRIEDEGAGRFLVGM